MKFHEGSDLSYLVNHNSPAQGKETKKKMDFQQIHLE